MNMTTDATLCNMYVRIKQCVHRYKIYKGPLFFSLKYFRERKVTKGTIQVSTYVHSFGLIKNLYSEFEPQTPYRHFKVFAHFKAFVNKMHKCNREKQYPDF